MGHCLYCHRSGVSVDSASMCSACRTAKAIKKETDGNPDYNDWLGWESLPFTLVLIYSLGIGFGEPKILGLFENNWIEAIVTFAIGSLIIAYVNHKSDSGSKLFKFVLIAINLIIIYLLLKWFGVFD